MKGERVTVFLERKTFFFLTHTALKVMQRKINTLIFFPAAFLKRLQRKRVFFLFIP